jgi:hypothetical protein
MVKEITCYEDASGKLHKSPYEAHRADLVLFLKRCDAVNEGSASVLAKYITDNSKEVGEMLEAIRRNAPPEDVEMVLVA